MYLKLDVFDFDGTLFRSPTDSEENKRLFEEKTGIPWVINKSKSKELSQKLGKSVGMRSGWYGRRETLQPPLVPDPAPKNMFIQETCMHFLESKANPQVLTLFLTGRHSGLRDQVLKICGDGKIIKTKRSPAKNYFFVDLIDLDVFCHFLGDDGPKPEGIKPSETFEWKVWIISQYLKLYQNISDIEIWEDRQSHIENFEVWGQNLSQNITINKVK